ncbi:MAG: cysteine hydrolase [Candidatus Dormibacteraeota bacterium]|uniref:Cysteine hydrolase n=2 Tax=Candidatus Dormibacteria TaxID=3126996 RepID=A0A934JSN0_9BACT|nr:cysteine hydrolase [Candidatus Dormibacteraeota bacterium]MBJ7603942.1 cysteine hydrolase [Candidatus Dormibacteraeota bacterium]MBJ7607179.1 cysteine hydrolase [Candidatus Dormibacteraeota bacterium]
MRSQKRPRILRTLRDKVRPEITALLIIDMCNDFIHPEGKTAGRAQRPIAHAVAVIPQIQRLVEAARAAGVLAVYGQHTTLPGHASDSGSWLDARSRATYSVEDICVDQTWGQQIINELAPAASDVVVKKHRYSAFAGTNLDMVLRSAGILTTVCCGVSTNVCVESTAREAFSHDYYVVVPADACASWDMSLHEAALASARHRYGTVCTAAELEQIWRKA